MGLDCYVEPYQEGCDCDDGGQIECHRCEVSDEIKAKFSHLRLAGYQHEGLGNDGRFRGKVYDAVFRAITRFSLYDRLTPNILKLYVLPRLTEFLEKGVPKGTCLIDARKIDPMIEDAWRYHTCTVQELRDLKNMVEICIDNNLSIVGWY